jgi:alpha-ketoglutarate-dependent 2,4-dichlorophenoxyacetate dioxygenase
MNPVADAHTAGQPLTLDELRIRPLHPVFAARVDGLDLASPVPDSLVRAIDAAMDRFAVLVIPNQRLDDPQQFAFASRFGPIESAASGVKQRNNRLAIKEMNDISNLAEDGTILPPGDRSRMYALGNLLWHSDSSFKAVPAKYSMLHARVVPPEGGETEFADMRAAWDALPEKMKARVRDLICDHSIVTSRKKLGFEDFTPEELKRGTPVPQRLVRRHESSGRLSLFLSAHIGGIHGWPVPEALALINELTEFATQRKFVYPHRWSVHDLVIWDNRCTMHRGRSYDGHLYPRDLRRATVQGTRPSVEEPL